MFVELSGRVVVVVAVRTTTMGGTMLLRRKPDVEYRGSQAVATISPATAIRLDCPSTGRAR